MSSPQEKQLTILIAEDQVDILEMMESQFKEHGFATITATSGNGAIELLKQHKVDVVVSDYKMPNGNGLVLLNYVSSLALEERPVFFFTSGQADIIIEELLKAGAKNFYPKPFAVDDFFKDVERELIEINSKKKKVA